MSVTACSRTLSASRVVRMMNCLLSSRTALRVSRISPARSATKVLACSWSSAISFRVSAESLWFVSASSLVSFIAAVIVACVRCNDSWVFTRISCAASAHSWAVIGGCTTVSAVAAASSSIASSSRPVSSSTTRPDEVSARCAQNVSTRIVRIRTTVVSAVSANVTMTWPPNLVCQSDRNGCGASSGWSLSCCW